MTETDTTGIAEAVSTAETEAAGIADAVNNAVDTAVQETKYVTDIFTKIADYVQGILPTVIYALIIFLIGTFLVKIAVKIVLKFMEKANVDKTIYGFVRSLVSILLYTLLIVITLTILKVPMTSIVAVIGAAGLAIGLALQNSLSNVAGGFIILLSKPFKVGDFIETADISGTVENINIISTTILTPDNKTIHVPNGSVSSARITNYTEKNIRRLDINFSVSYECDYKKAKTIIMNVIDKNPLAIKDPEPFVRVGEHADSAIIIHTRVWVNASDYAALNYDLLEQVKDEFDNCGIEIPYNHLDVHVLKD